MLIKLVAKAPPIKKLPSAVKSAKSSNLYVKNIPKAKIQQGKPEVNILNKTLIKYGIAIFLIFFYIFL